MAVNFAAPNRRHRAAVKQASEKLELAATDQSRADSLFVETDIDTVLQQLAAFFRRSGRYARLLAEAGNTIGVDVARFPATTPPHLRLRSLRILNMNFLPQSVSTEDSTPHYQGSFLSFLKTDKKLSKFPHIDVFHL